LILKNLNFMHLKIYTDGGSRGNPGPSGLGVVLINKNKVIGKYFKFLGRATNNEAEYAGILYGLKKAKEKGAKRVDMYMDSLLAVKQLNQEYKLKNKNLAKYFIKIWNLKDSFDKVSFSHIPREKNNLADELVNKAIDQGIRR